MEKLKALTRLEESLNKLPAVGKKSAERIAFAMLNMEEEDLKEFALAISSLKENVKSCSICGALSEEDICPICKDKYRDRTTLLVVSSQKDVFSFEKTEAYHGLYHVLGGTINLSKGNNIDSLAIPQLLERVNEGEIKEIIIATNPTVEGETTALYLAKLIAKYPINVTRLAYGLPMGANLDYTDSLTLNKAIEGRRKI
jgi:recombination protein RecR